MSKKIVSLLLIVCMIFAMVPGIIPAAVAEEAANGIHIDFKDTVRQMEEQEWFSQLALVKTGRGNEARRVGSKINTPGMPDSQKQAYNAMRQWLDETQIWSINEKRGNFINPSGNRLYFCADEDELWGLSLNNYYRGSDPENSLSLTVQVDQAGRYDLSMEVVHVVLGSLDFPIEADIGETNFGYVDVYVNGMRVMQDYCFRGEGLQKAELGTVTLNEGSNEITFCCTKNYVGNSNPTPAYHFNLRSLTISEMEKASVTEEARKTFRLQGGYLPLDAVVSAETHSVEVRDENILTAHINEDGRLEVFGLVAGETNVEVFENGELLCTVPVRVDEADYSEMSPVVMDFKGFARDLRSQSFWNAFRNAADEKTKYVGTMNYYDALTAEEKAAYDEMIAWSKENFDWYIDESLSLLSVSGAFKRMYINGEDDVPWGFSGYTYYHGKGTPAEAANSKFGFVVDAPCDGWYKLDMTTFKENEGWAGIYSTIGDNSGGDTIAVYVNGETAIYDYSLVDANISITDNLGAVYLKKGANSVVVDSLLSFNNLPVAGRSNVPLVKMTFDPLTGVTVGEYLNKNLDLRQSYFSYNADVSGLTVESSADRIVTCEINAGGVITMTGVSAGKAKIFVKRGDEILCVVPVEVTAFEGTLDQLQGNPVTLDFMAFADRAAEQHWWEGDGMKVTSAHTQVTDWLSKNDRWNLAGGELTVAGKDADCGIAVEKTAQLSVQMPAQGLYNMTISGSANGASVTVNGKTVRTGLNADGTFSLGAVELSKDNTVTIAGKVSLCNVVFTPLGSLQTEVGRSYHLDLEKTYLAFDEQADSSTVSLTGNAASLSMEGGIAVITGVTAGESVLTVGSTVVTVRTLPRSDLDYITYTADGF